MKRANTHLWPIGLLLLSVAIATAHAEDVEGVSVRVTPQFCVEGSNVRVTVRVQPHEDNRMLTIEADSEDFFRRSSIQLRGASGPVQHELLLNALPSGHYYVRATVRREDDETRSALKTLRVVGGAEPDMRGLGEEESSGP